MTAKEQSTRQVVQLRAGTLAVMFAMLGGLALFAATSILLIRGGQDVGLHLGLLRHYLPGYTVTWSGAFLGLAYGAVIGAVLGATIASVYNSVAGRRNPA